MPHLIEERPAGRIVRLTLNRPSKRNALNAALAEDLLTTLRRLADDDGVGAVIITGAGRAFCAGGDIAGWSGRTTVDAVRIMRERAALITCLDGFPRPVIAAVNGPAVGAGFSVALACDIVLMSDDASFSMPFLGLGLAPDLGASYFLPRQVGLATAKEMALTGRTVPPEEALRRGLATSVHRGDDLPAAALACAARFDETSAFAAAATLDLLDRSAGRDLDAALEAEARIYGDAVETEHHKEAVARFLARAR